MKTERRDYVSEFCEEDDEVRVLIDGGMQKGGITISFTVPIGHDAECCRVEVGDDDGWREVKNTKKAT